MFVWCMLMISLTDDCTKTSCSIQETAVRGIVIQETTESYLIDFSEYAKKQGYIGNWSMLRTVSKNVCVEGK